MTVGVQEPRLSLTFPMFLGAGRWAPSPEPLKSLRQGGMKRMMGDDRGEGVRVKARLRLLLSQLDPLGLSGCTKHRRGKD